MNNVFAVFRKNILCCLIVIMNKIALNMIYITIVRDSRSKIVNQWNVQLANYLPKWSNLDVGYFKM